jgi:poly-gamma-glutamate synthesis protein (capsule biosynthesis protein)
MDWGREAFFDTIDALKEQELQVIGVGRNIEEARRPAILERKGTQVAFLAYNSILPLGYWAEVDRPGCTPLRAWTLYEPIEPAQPGRPCQIHTFPHRDDLEAMVDDIKKARSKADLVIVSMHCGIHFVPAVLAEYQKEIAHVAIDSGADLIIDTHAHILKGIEVYRGKVIFYSLCNFALELPARKEVLGSQSQRELQDIAIYGTHPEWLPYEKPDPEYPTYPFHPDARKTLIVKCIISNKAIKNVSFLPSYINKEAEPEVLSSRDTRFGEVVKYMEEITRSQELGTRYIIEGDEVVIHRESA